MSELTSQQEEMLLSLLRRGLDDSDPAPEDVTDFAKAALSWSNIDADLAQLSYDSSEEPAAVRGVATARILAFQSEEWLVDLEYDPFSSHLMGQIEPPGHLTVELHMIGSVLRTESDDRGRFDFDGIHSGPVVLVIRVEGEDAIKTEWIVL